MEVCMKRRVVRMARADDLNVIMAAVEEVTKVTREEMYKKRGKENVMIARHLFHFASCNLSHFHHAQISAFTKKERSTTTSSIETAIGLIETSDTFLQMYDTIESIVKEKFKK